MSLFRFIPSVEAATGSATSGVTRQADPSTMDTYKQMLDFSSNTRYAGRLWSDKTVFAYGYDDGKDPNWYNNTLTLTMEDDGVTGSVELDEDFLHVYSVLGSSQELAENVPVDIVISMDITASMLSSADIETLSGTTGRRGSTGTGSNLAIALDAVNELIDQVRAYSPASRIGIVVYWGTGYQMIPFVEGDIEFKGYSLRNGVYAAGGAAIQPVLHYVITDSTTPDTAKEDGTKNGYYVYDPVSGNHFRYADPKDDNKYFDAKYMTYNVTYNVNINGDLQMASGGVSVEDTGNGKNSDLGAGTNIEAGIYTAMRGVADLGLDKGVKYTLTNGSTVSREPIVVILSDGGTYHTLVKEDDVDTDSNNDWIDENTTIGGNWWDVSEPQKAAATKYRDGTKEEQSLIYSSGMVADVAAMLQGAYWKAAIANVYGKDVSGVPVYTIGLDVNSLYIGIADKANNKDDENGSTNPDGNTVFTSPAALNPEYAFGTHGDVNITNTTSATYTFNEFKAAVDEWKAGGNNPIKIQTDLIRSSNGTDRGGFTTGNPGSLQRQSTEYVFNVPSQDNQGSTFATKYNVKPDQIDLVYTNAYFSAKGTGTTSEGGSSLTDTFNDIFTSFTQNIFVPVQGDNDLGVGDAVTFMDPMGKYMEVKDVKGVSLFGKYYEIVKTAVYDYQWNDAYIRAKQAAGAPGFEPGVSPLPEGWYRGDATAEAEYAASLDGTHCSTSEEAWAAGWVYRVGYTTAGQFVPTLKSIYDPGGEESTPDDMTTKARNTEYTFYRLDINDTTVREALHMNPAYGNSVPDGVVYDGNEQKHLSNPGVYALADMRIWVEDTGDYNDNHSDLLTDANYDEALWVNIPANMLPLRKISINAQEDEGITYTTNLEAGSAGYEASFPLRVYYTVGVSDEVLENGRINMAGAIDVEYINKNKASTEAAAAARYIDQGSVEFFSNWYNPLNRYNDYATSTIDYTYGDPVTSFSPASGNRYYMFQKALPLYNTAYVWVPNEGVAQPADGEYTSDQGTWRKVVINEEATGDGVRIFSPTEFGGRLLAQELEPSADTGNPTQQQDSIWDALNTKSITSARDGDIILLKNHRLSDVTKNGTDPFPSDGYFFLAIEFYNLEAGDKAEYTQYVITRKGSEFGSAYRSAGISNGDMLVWHDMSGKYPDYPYLSATDTGDNTRGKAYLGWPLDATGYFVGCDKKDNPKPDLTEDAYSAAKAKVPDADVGKYEATWERQKTAIEDGDWVVCAKPGGLRVGSLSQAVQSKIKPDDNTLHPYPDAYLTERFGESYKTIENWGYYANNVTRTANNYYMPTISTGSTSSDVRVNTYLGNNGRLYIMDTTLLVTKLVEDSASHTLMKNEDEFNYQVYIDGVTGPQSAIVVKYMGEDGTNGSWQRQFHYIDLQLDTQLFLQTQDGQKAMVDATGKRVVSSGDGYAYAEGGVYPASDGGPYYVFIGKNRDTEEKTGLTDTSFRVYHNEEVDENGTVGTGDVTVVSGGAGTKGTISAATVWLVSVDRFTSTWEGLDPVGESDFNIEGKYDHELNTFELMTIDPNVHDETSALFFDTPYLTASAYWTKEVVFGENANPDGDGKDATHATMAEGDLYDQIIPFADRPDLIPGTLTNGEIAQHTAEFRLKNGYGLLFSGIDSGSVYRVTEKLTEEQMDMGYTLKRVSHTQQVGSTSTYQPGKQQIPVYYHTGTTYGDIYPQDLAANIPDQYRRNPTQYGLTWALKQDGTKNEETYYHLEPFFNTNAVVWEAYSTMNENAQGDNHHQPTSVPDGTSAFWLWHSDTNQNENTNTTQRIDRHTVMDNPSCVPLEQGGCDENIGDGQVRHYFFKDGVLLDQHYYGEGSGYLRDFARFVTSPTVHFAVKDEPAQVNRNPAEFPFTSSTNYIGVYSVFGNTGTFEESANFVNTINKDKTETQINDSPVEPSEEDPNTYPAVQVGDEITYEIKWTNATGDRARVVIIDPLDKGVDFVSATEDGRYIEKQDDANAYLAEIYKDVKPPVEVDSGHVVIWVIENTAAGTDGTVELTVKVNGSAAEWWDYDGDGVADKPVDAPDNDFLVRNRATVRVADNAYNTNTVVNPLNKPSKTETLIEHGDKNPSVEDETIVSPGEPYNNLRPGEGEDEKLYGPTVFPGDVITYEIEWNNYENVPATISIRDPLDSNVEFVDASFDPETFIPAPSDDVKYDPATEQKLEATTINDKLSTGKAPGYGDQGTDEREAIIYTDHTVTYNLCVVPAGASGKVTLRVRVLDSATPVGYVDNTAFVTVGQNPEQQTDIIENPTPEEEKTETNPGDGVMVKVGDEITYQISWQNYKENAARVIVMDTLDPGVNFVSADNGGVYYESEDTLSGDGYDDVEIPAHTVVWDLGVKEGQEKGQVTLTVTVNKDAFLEYKYNETADGFTPAAPSADLDYEVLNQARVKVDNDAFLLTQIVENPLPDKDETEIDHEPSGGSVDSNPTMTPKEGADQTVTGPTVYVGDVITYTIHWTNGHDEAANVVIRDPLDPGVEFVEASYDDVTLTKTGSATGEGVNISYDEATHTVTWILENRAAKESGIVTLKVKVTEKATPAGIVDNQASVKVDTDPFVETKIIENPTPHLEKTEIAPGEGMQVMPGDEIDYQISWHNYEEDEADVVITDKLDPGVDFVSAGVSGGMLTNGETTKKPETGNLTIMLSGGPGADPTEEITFTLTLTAPEGKTLETGDWEGPDGSTDAWKEGVNTFTLKPGQQITFKDLPVGTGYSLTANGEEVVKEAKLGTYGSAVTVTVTKETQPLSQPVQSTETPPEEATGGEPSANGTQEISNFGVPIIDKPQATRDEDEPTTGDATDPTDPVTDDATDPTDPVTGDATDPTDPVTGDATEPTDPVPGGDTEPTGPATGEQDGNEVPSGTEPAQDPQEPETVTVYSFSVEIHDYATPADDPHGAMPIAENTGFDPKTFTYNGEEAALHQTIEETDGKKVDMYYFAKAHVVVWVLHDRPANASGVVDLKVRVNEDAEKFWSYDHPEYGPDENTRDDRVRNQAGVRVGDDPEIKTRIIENPTEPEKTETHIDDRDVSRDLVADEDGYVGPEVNVGDTITYKITWQNNASDQSGQPAKAEITITDELDPGVEFVSASDGGTYDPATRTVTWDLGEKDPRDRGVVTLTVRVLSSALDDDKKVENEATVTVGNESTVTKKVENPVTELGGLTVTKTVKGSLGDTEKLWHFTVTLSDPTLYGDYGDMTFNAGVAEFTLKHGESLTATDLPAGIEYSVVEAEANKDGYLTTSEGETGTIPAGDTAEAAFVNSKSTGPDPHKTEETPGDKTLVEVGDEITYKITWQNYDPVTATVVIRDPLDVGVDFVSADNNGVYDASTHTVTWTFEADPNTDGAVSLTVRVNENAREAGIVKNQAHVKVGNYPEVHTEIPENPLPGGLIVTKTVAGSEGDKTKDFHFTVTFDPADFDTSKVQITKNDETSDLTINGGTLSFTLKHGEKVEITGLPAGTDYTVTEQEANQDGYTTRSTGDQGTIPAGDTAEAAFVNMKPGDPDPHKTEVTPGDKTLVEVGDEITYKITWQNYDSEIADVVIRDPLDKGVDFVSADNGGVYDPSTHTVTWTFKADPNTDGAVSLTVRVNENAREAGIVKNQAHVKVGNYPEVHTEIPENPLPGGLIVTKVVTGTAGDTEKEWHFRVELSDKTINGPYGGMFFTDGVAEFTLKHGQSLSATRLPDGVTYTVTEQEANQDGYITRATGDEGTIQEGRFAEARFVNGKDRTPPPPTTPTGSTTPTTPDDTPKTGDSGNLGLWLPLLIVSLAGAAVTFVAQSGIGRKAGAKDRRGK